ncbi:MAG: hypothetical protein U0R44_01135 [Candidatus Micrarchaeia archaeon]
MYAAEEKVEEFLKGLGIKCEYERPVFLKDGGRPRVWTPDFYLPELGIYVEVWGSNREIEPVKKNWEYRKRVYEENEIPIALIDAYRYFISELIKFIETPSDFIIKEWRNQSDWNLLNGTQKSGVYASLHGVSRSFLFKLGKTSPAF